MTTPTDRDALTVLVRALDNTNWSSWQTTATFWGELEAAKAALAQPPQPDAPEINMTGSVAPDERVASRDVIGAVYHELSRAIAKFPTWPTDPLHALAVLGEEFGELTKDVLQMAYEPGKTSAENVRKEAIQTAAMALRFVASIDAYIYKAGEQHRQEQFDAERAAYRASGGVHPCYD